MTLRQLQHRLSTLSSERKFRRSVVWVALTLLFIWVGFFDTHSIYKRVMWHHKATQLAHQNDALKKLIEDIDHQLRVDITDETIERLARERYGMRREGETVYPIEIIE